MANTVQLGGPLGPLVDPTSGQQVPAKVWGTCTYDVGPGVDPRSVEENVRAQLLQATNAVVAHKLATNQVALPTLTQSLPHFVQEIVAQAGLDRLGARVVGIELAAALEQAAPAANMAPPAAMPPTPWQATANAFEQRAQERLDPSNYEVKAKINYGGLKIGISSDGGLDTKGLETQLKDKAKSEILWYGIGCGILLLVLLGVGGLGLYIYYSAKSGSTASTGKPVTAAWDGKSTFKCGGNEVVKIEKVTSKLTAGSAIEAGGNCKLELENVTLSAPTAIKASANAIVTVNGGSIEGTTYAVQALGAAQVKLSGTKVTGKNQALGAAKVTGP